jgi:2-polyprenyl-3-methyl-5-hydroxy-6-metoxy-1,4-benzoquinol methylase
MQQVQEKEYEYIWSDSELANCHSFIIKPLLSILPSPQKANGEKTKILDLGCGNGSLSNFLVTEGYEVVGIEESNQGVKQAQKNFPNCKFMQGSIYDLPYDKLECSFDIVLSVEVIEHLFYPKELVRAAKKCMKPDGQFILTTPYHGYLKNIALALSGKMDGHFHALWDGGHIKFFSVKTLKELLESEGYSDINFSFAGRMPYLWKTMLVSCKYLPL